jgi:MoxR-like ATPase
LKALVLRLASHLFKFKLFSFDFYFDKRVFMNSESSHIKWQPSNQQSSDQVKDAAALMERVLYEVKRVVVGQDKFLERILIALIAQGHLLIEGVPGLAKTLTVNTLAKVIQGSFKRIQFTPDLLPADLVGTRIFNQKTSEFSTLLGPVFANLLLADEINRAPAKVQSALLEVMQERQVTIAGESHKVPRPFLVMATQNPIETEGTYPLRRLIAS